MTENRRRMVESRFVTFPDLDWAMVFSKLSDSEGHRGENPRGWKADFNWLMESDDNVVKIAERPEVIDDYVPPPVTDFSELPEPGKSAWVGGDENPEVNEIIRRMGRAGEEHLKANGLR